VRHWDQDPAPPKRGCTPRAYAEIVVNMAGRHEARDLMVMKMTHGMIPGYVFSNIRATRELHTIGRHKIVARIENALIETEAERAGNRMALDNIRERLALFFDAEARMDTRTDGGRYRVEIDMPYLTRARTAEG